MLKKEGCEMSGCGVDNEELEEVVVVGYGPVAGRILRGP